MSLQQVDPATIAAWRWEGLIGAIGAAIASAVPLAAMAPTLSLIIPTLVAVTGAITSWFWPAVRYRHLAYGIDDIGLVIHEGVLWRAQTLLPRARIQHSDVSQGPLQRRYGIATLKLYTAGSRYTKVELEGLRHDDAVALRDSLVKRTDTSGR
jgi:uncharacterized protein